MSQDQNTAKQSCACWTDQPHLCETHGPNDMRGLAAWFKAGMPCGFPFRAHCATCGTEGLLYPNVEIDDREGTGEFVPTLICPKCSGPQAEQSMVAAALVFGHELNASRIFAARGGVSGEEEPVAEETA